MPGQLSRVEFTLEDTIHGQELTPENIDLPTHTKEADERVLAALWQKGREAWRNVPSGTSWVEDLRGNS